jgi:hypothetical protein
MVACHREFGKGLMAAAANEQHLVPLAFVIVAGIKSASR